MNVKENLKQTEAFIIMAKTAIYQNTLRVTPMCFQKWRREELILISSRKRDLELKEIVRDYVTEICQNL